MVVQVKDVKCSSSCSEWVKRLLKNIDICYEKHSTLDNYVKYLDNACKLAKIEEFASLWL